MPPARSVGAIDLGTSHRLSPLVRPAAGQTLLYNLQHATRRLRDERTRTGRPVILEP